MSRVAGNAQARSARQPADAQPSERRHEAVDTMEITHLRKAALAGHRGSQAQRTGYKRDLSTWAKSVKRGRAGCVAAARNRHRSSFGIPCVWAGRSDRALNYWTKD